ncbi:MAG: hypothetical protein CHACPFDD_00443 [Phycisphaerae bacterium]|nr:hypothetical protein [Phycisphaerae bacterium]
MHARTRGLAHAALVVSLIATCHSAFAQACFEWTRRQVLGPSARAGHAMAFDIRRGVTVLFGGSDVGLSGETWEWDGSAWTLRATSGPTPRTRHAMAYDARRGVTVLFGGNDGSVVGDTWEWDGTAWLQKPTRDPQFGTTTHSYTTRTAL